MVLLSNKRSTLHWYTPWIVSTWHSKIDYMHLNFLKITFQLFSSKFLSILITTYEASVIWNPNFPRTIPCVILDSLMIAISTAESWKLSTHHFYPTSVVEYPDYRPASRNKYRKYVSVNNKELCSKRTKAFAFYSMSVFKAASHYRGNLSLSNIATEGCEQTEEK